eukprot:4618785-Pyramimonas_sp.AAC.1
MAPRTRQCRTADEMEEAEAEDDDGEEAGAEKEMTEDGDYEVDALRPSWKQMLETTNGIHYGSNDTKIGVDIEALC